VLEAFYFNKRCDSAELAEFVTLDWEVQACSSSYSHNARCTHRSYSSLCRITPLLREGRMDRGKEQHSAAIIVLSTSQT